MSSPSCGSRGASRSRQLGFELVDRGLELGDLGGEGIVVGAEFARGLQVAAGGLELAVGRDDR